MELAFVCNLSHDSVTIRSYYQLQARIEMTKETKFTVDDKCSIIPYLIVNDGLKAIEFYKKVFGAQEIISLEGPDSMISHAELMIGNSRIMLTNERPDVGMRSAHIIGDSPINIYLYVEDVDKISNAAVEAGSILEHPVTDKFYGDRACSLKDPFGITWYVATRVEHLTQAEIKNRAQKLMAQTT